MGDDSLQVVKRPIDTKELIRDAAELHNVKIKTESSKHTGVFCHLLVFKTGQTLDCGPDFCHMRHKFAVSNRKGVIPVELQRMRVLSYCHSIGLTEQTKMLQELHSFD